jgi:cell wall-associated NlpC family hydrolase
MSIDLAPRLPRSGLMAQLDSVKRSDEGRACMPVLRNVAMLIAVSATAFVGAAPPANAGTATPPSPTAQRAASFALQEINAPWAFQGASVATGFDSAGLIVWAFGKAGRKGLPHLPELLRMKGAPVSRANLERGDVVFFDDAGYAGIYLGHGRSFTPRARFVGSASTGSPGTTSTTSAELSASSNALKGDSHGAPSDIGSGRGQSPS